MAQQFIPLTFLQVFVRLSFNPAATSITECPQRALATNTES